ncbi:hypothetical protein WICMUC_002644 [Wickerhamomyces mucosus]|uniref:Major facilitator superfamily (MFS) profile domain-containing protein n=1 Tax=Wickerhamomyces mucosus TaxID=1378264 RepID=A0A9P8PQ61_9ASCO|nr:hypothetical protein WICMUC_002644 [Wickerhamomyces mucosus]
MSTEKKDQFEVEISSLHSEEEVKKPFNKWKFFFFNSESHPDNDDLFEGEPYTIDNMLEYEAGGTRLDISSFPLWKKIVGFWWDGVFLPPSERNYMLKVDFFLFFYTIIACFVKDLDQSAILNSYVSGMKEDLDMYGSNDYNYLTTFFNIGYLSFSILMSTVNKTLRPSFFLPFCEALWTIIVMSTAAAKSKQQVFGLRLLQGVVESTFFPGLVMVISEWYSVESLAKRIFMLDATGSVASMFAGYIQTGVYTNLNGKYGIPGWKWVFIIDGIISMPVAVLGFFCLPDFPENSRAPWLTKKDRQFALARVKAHKKVKPSPITPKRFVKVFLTPKLWVFLGPYVIGCLGSIGFNYFILFLKSLGTLSVQKVNLIPTAANAVTFVSLLISSSFSDYFRNRIFFLTIHQVIGLIVTILLVIWTLPQGVIIFAYIFGGAAFSQPLAISWFAETFYDEPDLKGISIGIGNTLVYSFTAFLPLGLFPSEDAPRYRTGYRVSIAFWIISATTNFIFYFYAKNHNRKREERFAAEKQEQGELTEEEFVEI